MSAAGRTAVGSRGTGTCSYCGKVCYKSRADARSAKRSLHPGEKMHAYRCGFYWHFGHDELWREIMPEHLIWRPMPLPARAQVLALARATFIPIRGAA